MNRRSSGTPTYWLKIDQRVILKQSNFLLRQRASIELGQLGAV